MRMETSEDFAGLLLAMLPEAILCEAVVFQLTIKETVFAISCVYYCQTRENEVMY